MKRQHGQSGHKEGGFTLVEVVFGAVIMALMVGAIGTLYIDNLKVVTLGKARAIALGVANEKMEAIRDLPYDSLATQFGAIYPPGSLLDNETVTRDNYRFTVHTDINFVDDPYDGFITCPCASGPASGKPKDLYPYDYKKVMVTVKLASSGAEVAQLSTDVAGKAAETSSNTGILSVTVLDSNAQPVPDAVVTIVNSVPTPDVNITTTTDSNGLVVVPRLPPDSGNNYQVTASLGGYSTEQSIPEPSGSQTAVILNPNIIAQNVQSITLKIDRISTMYVHVVDTSGAALASKAITITGAKKTKQTPNVFKYSQVSTTNASGDITLNGMEWDSYSFVAPAGYYLAASMPYAPVVLAANSSQSITLVLSTSSTWPRIVSAAPITQQTGTNPVSVKVTGSNLGSGTTLKLKLTGQPDITGSSCVSAGSSPTQTLTCNMNLTGAVTGAWDVAVTNSGNTTTQVGGFSVTP